ncbi:MAG: hypothetical protein ACK52I_26345 [Pseudomonadota bacterium]|jgi:hypothetical protein
MSDAVIPRPRPGDRVLFSTDVREFSNPALGWVVDGRGEGTANILVFSAAGFFFRSSVHYRYDPDLAENPGWSELGAWDFCPEEAENKAMQKRIEELTTRVNELAKKHGEAKSAGK